PVTETVMMNNFPISLAACLTSTSITERCHPSTRIGLGARLTKVASGERQSSSRRLVLTGTQHLINACAARRDGLACSQVLNSVGLRDGALICSLRRAGRHSQTGTRINSGSITMTGSEGEAI